MANDLSPNYMQFRYQSSYGLHTATIPTRAYDPGSSVEDLGQFARWSDDTAISADAMVDALAEALQDGFHTTTTLIDCTIFAKAPGAVPSTVVGYKELTLTGSNASAEWRKATQMTLTFRTTLFGGAKLVTLDTPHAGFDRFVPGAAAAWVIALAGVYTNPIWAFAGRDGGRPSQWLQGTVTLNENLRRQYRMT